MAGLNVVISTFLFMSLTSWSCWCVKSECNFPPQFWCKDPQISKDCGVFEACQNFRLKTLAKPDRRVEFALYYESLCPGCRAMIDSQLYPTYQKIGDIMNITLVPYGNAQEIKTWSEWKFMCQHGKEECIGNLIETCAINKMGAFSTYFPFIHCMETTPTSVKSDVAAEACAKKLKIENFQDIMNCSRSAEGNRLEHEMALKTEALRPEHQYVPWVTVNGMHTEEINQMAVDDLLKLICNVYTGPKPVACQKNSNTGKKNDRDYHH